ncbi:MAG: Putative electron transport protein YccM [SAR116 cluster bacterium]|nr:MAG: Putative electron transport protein YccM [SAR116 cluster bacterium]
MEEQFRDSIGTINEAGKRAWVYPKKPVGRFYNYRKWVSYGLLIFLVAAPFVKINGHPFLMFNVLDRRFSIFSIPFWPQDFHLFVITMIIGVIFIALFTVAFGRIFCGWMCPQTIFLEMVFRRIEYWIEGDRGAQIRLDRQAWNAEKIRKKTLKWVVFALISFLIANVFLAYLISSDTLIQYIIEGPANHLNTLVALIIFTGVFYFVFAWFREQVCIIACPYGRLQGVLLDNKSVVVAYDHKRGEDIEGRKKFRKGENRSQLGYGDCIDCNQCVQVCPTGIDIRNGTQLECVNCTACIDACDSIMDSVALPKGLIRYTSQDHIEKKSPFVFSARLKGYTAVLFILIGVLVGMLFLRNPVEATILRLPGQLFEHKEGGIISNVYTYKLVNKTDQTMDSIHFELKNKKGLIRLVPDRFVTLKANHMGEGTLFIELPQTHLSGDKNKLEILIYQGNTLIETTSASFLGPRSFR